MQESHGDLGRKGQKIRQLKAHTMKLSDRKGDYNSIIGKERRAPDSSAVSAGEAVVPSKEWLFSR